jgi:TM2 domain-containing membrane protein YozV
MDALETQLLVNQAKVKSPGFASVLGFFFPWAAAFYNGKVVPGILFLVLDLIFFALSFLGIGIPLLLLYGFVGAYQNYKWATAENQKALERLVAHHKQQAALQS